ncbi:MULTISPECIES: DUF1189 domain-containing protein [unclassified Bacillus (in: firmicutes)]|uniref:DUF1189 domain-containing protein n=1 Tax=unclassified Bacillus (in: firmicutes) TaxID=185979 RepID=UPI0008E669CB|nr:MULTISPECIES: DUF1189 domain-containing protein [unclassified Bacillus (in: firmicutes)]SFA96013.1 Protein of unknown function [Bacillus sp. UNCCL13]SFQ79533.1 Protein of unknown function [Bacillus sp. cl95]
MSIFKQFFKSIYSPRDIAVFRFQGIGKTILYVFFLTLIAVLPSIFYFSISANSGIDSAQKGIEKKLPDFSIEDFELKTNETSPITVVENDTTIIFDGTGSVSKEDIEHSNNSLALLKNEFVLVAGNQVHTYPYSMFTLKSITKDELLGFIDKVDQMMYIILPVFFILIYLFTTAIKFIEVSFLAVLGLVLKNLIGRNVEYRHTWRMAAYSVTLPTLFFTIMAAIQTNVPNGFILNWFVGIIVLYLAIKEIPKPKGK